MLLSALPETSRVEEGLKRRVVGGKSWAFRIVRSGWNEGASIGMVV
jgi:hypothetical protein